MIWINLIGTAFIVLIVWWFWFSQPINQVVQNGVIDIEVNNGTYNPAAITIAANKPFTLRFKCLDPSPCAQSLLSESLGLNEILTLNGITTIKLDGLVSGEYSFYCQMKMYRGVIYVV